VDLEGRRRQAGRFNRKGDANKESLENVNELNAQRTTPGAARTMPGAVLTFARWHEIWPMRVRRDDRTINTNKHRISKYVIPHLPEHGRLALSDLSRGMLHDVQVALLEAGYAKSTIDGALSALSAVLGYAMDEGRIETNVAYRMARGPRRSAAEPDQSATGAAIHTAR
jgi:hypothetical protein